MMSMNEEEDLNTKRLKYKGKRAVSHLKTCWLWFTKYYEAHDALN